MFSKLLFKALPSSVIIKYKCKHIYPRLILGFFFSHAYLNSQANPVLLFIIDFINTIIVM